MTDRRVTDPQAELYADEEAARAELDAALEAASDAETAVAVPLIDADPDEVRRRAAAVGSTRAAAVVEYRTLGARPDFDEDAEQAALDALGALDGAKTETAAVRRQSNVLLGVGNLLGVGAIGHAAFRVLALTADPVGWSVSATMMAGGSFPMIAAAVAAGRVVLAARRARRLRPGLAAALQQGGCRSVRELAGQRERFDRWQRHARIAADAGDRLALAVRDWYDVAGVGADPDEVEDLLVRAEWYRITRAAVERARLAHGIAAARLARADSITESVPEPMADRLQIALLRLRRGARITWRRAS